MSQTARDIMTSPALTVSPDTSIQDLAKRFTSTRVSGFPVVDDAGALLGVVTEADLLHQNESLHIPTTFVLLDAVITLGSSKKLQEEMLRMAAAEVAEIMTPDPVTVQADAPVAEVARLLAEQRIHTLPVLSSEGELVGVIGKLDVIRTLAG
ncbi:MAG TPA: CBS domain-containing protein [Deferrisomatales bacterium]|nr:CBS domain-containing protein [Deferrisomatales bacterium]